MKKTLVYLLITIIFINLTSCSGKGNPSGKDTYALYKVLEGGYAIEKTDYVLKEKHEDNVDIINELLENFNPEMITNMVLRDGQLTIYFNEDYNNMKEREEILYRASVVKTMCAMDDINYVEFYVMDKPLSLDGDIVGVMDEYSFLDTLGGEGYKQKKYVNLYFADMSGRELREVNTAISYDLTIPVSELLMQYIIAGPEKLEDTNISEIKQTISDDVKVKSMKIRDKICYIDFSKEFEKIPDGVASDVVVYSIVNTLCELPNINKVFFTIEGEQKNTFGDIQDFNKLFERNLDIVINEGKG